MLDGAASHVDSLSLQKYSPSEVIAKLYEWMDTFQMNPKAILSRYGLSTNFTPNAQLKENSNQDRMHHGRTELRWVYDCSRNFSRHSWIQPPKTWIRPFLAQITLAQLIRKAATVRNTQVTLK